MGLFSGLAAGYLKAMPGIDARNQQYIENQRAEEKQRMWLAQQQRKQDAYEQAQKQLAANRMLVSDPTKYRGLMSLEGPMQPENQQWLQTVQSQADPQMLYNMSNYMTPDEQLQRDLALKIASRAPKSPPKPEKTKFQDENGVWRWGLLGKDGEMIKTKYKAPPPGKGITIENKREGSLSSGLGTLGSKIMGDAYEASQAAKGRIAELKRVLNNKSTLGGPFADWMLKGKQVLDSMGFNVEGLTEDEMAKSLGNLFTVAARGGAFSGGKPLTGATSDKDIELLQFAVPSLKQTPEGRKLLAQILTETEQSKVDFWNGMQQAYAKDGEKFNPLSYIPDTSGKKLQKYAKEAAKLSGIDYDKYVSGEVENQAGAGGGISNNNQERVNKWLDYANQ